MLKKEMPDYLNTLLTFDERVDDLIDRMTIEEKISQMLHNAPPIERLGVPGYNWWNECLHGIGRAGEATVFPQAIGMAASWNPDLIYRIAHAISDEARGKFNKAGKSNKHQWYWGLTFWSPNINIFRDPRWGRGQETYGEDPYLTSRLGVNFIKGLQGSNQKYLKLVATPKHYAVHSGPEADRHRFNAVADWRDLRTTYLPAFEAAVVEGGAVSIMGAYNRTNGEACCASETLLQQVLREEWDFKGFVVSDCGAISDIYRDHKIVSTPAEAAALSVKNGCDLNCGETYTFLVDAYHQGLISEDMIDRSVRRLFMARFQLGMFDPIEDVPFSSISPSVVDCSAHRALALEAARESMVLLKNDGILPLDRRGIRRIAVIGPKADDELVLRGNYFGDPVESYSIFQGIKNRAGKDVTVEYAPGCDLGNNSTDSFSEAIELAKRSDINIVVLGLSQLFEGEEGQEEGNAPGERSFGDRTHIDLPGVQEDLLEAISAVGKPVILVLLNGSAVAINWAQQHLPAILEAWYPGEAGGLAVGDVLFGDYNPSGRLPVTFYQSTDDLPDFTDYSMRERTYRYFSGKPLYPFGYGLSYSKFSYTQARLLVSTVSSDETQKVRVTVTNDGKRPGDEVVQVYISDVESTNPVPNYSLVGFQKIHLGAGCSKVLEFEIDPSQLRQYDDTGTGWVEPGVYRVAIGGHAPVVKEAVVPLTELLTLEYMVVEALREEKLCYHDVTGIDLPYLLYTPVISSALRPQPLLIFLHGMGERGNDLCSVRMHGLPKLIEEGFDFPGYVVTPQCPSSTTWSEIPHTLDGLLKSLVEEYPIDLTRIYITGLSMGGYGTWKMLSEYPQWFAAAAPICGWFPEAMYTRTILHRLKNIPIWTFHGEADSIVPVTSTEALVQGLKEIGGKIRYTCYPGVDHNSWEETYNNPALYQWLLSKRKS